MTQIVTSFVDKHLRVILLVVGFLITFYLQSVQNTQHIQDMKVHMESLSNRIDEQDAQITSLQVDRAAYQATVEQVALIREDIKEVRQDVKELLKKR